jgi:hypothetical protein
MGDVTVRELSEITSSDDPASPPKSTAVAPVNPDPVTLTTVPPEVVPASGLIAVTVGPVAAVAGPLMDTTTRLAARRPMAPITPRCRPPLPTI